MSKGKALRLLNDMIDTLPEGMDILLSKDIYTTLNLTEHRGVKLETNASIPKRSMYGIKMVK
jgi:hypothetical protein